MWLAEGTCGGRWEGEAEAHGDGQVRRTRRKKNAAAANAQLATGVGLRIPCARFQDASSALLSHLPLCQRVAPANKDNVAESRQDGRQGRRSTLSADGSTWPMWPYTLASMPK